MERRSTPPGAVPGPERRRPHWRHVYRELRLRIDRGDIAPGGRMPTQSDLARELGASRHIVRRALAALTEDNRIRSWQGKGCFVTATPLTYPIRPRTSFSDNVRASGHAPRIRLLSARSRPADPSVAERLNISARNTVLVAEVVRFVDDRPAGLARHHFDPRRFPTILDLLVAEGSVSRALRALGLETFRRGETRIETRSPTAKETLILEIPRSQPVLVLTGSNHDPSGQPVEAVQTVWRGDRIELAV